MSTDEFQDPKNKEYKNKICTQVESQKGFFKCILKLANI